MKVEAISRTQYLQKQKDSRMRLPLLCRHANGHLLAERLRKQWNRYFAWSLGRGLGFVQVSRLSAATAKQCVPERRLYRLHSIRCRLWVRI